MRDEVDRLVAAWQRERPDLDDRRGVRVGLTEAGKQRVDEALAALLARERELLEALSVQDQQALSTLLRRLVTPFEATR